MQFRHRTVLMPIITIVILCAFTLVAGAADDDPVTVPGILKAAECPLTDAQQKSIDDLDESQGFMAMMSINQIFTEEQIDALIKDLGEMNIPGMGGGGGAEAPRMVNNLFQVVVFEKEGVPMTRKQIDALKEIGADYQRMGEVYTAKQNEALQKYMGNMGGGAGGGGRGNGGGGSNGGGMRF